MQKGVQIVILFHTPCKAVSSRSSSYRSLNLPLIGPQAADQPVLQAAVLAAAVLAPVVLAAAVPPAAVRAAANQHPQRRLPESSFH
ncbi:hypothetical protein D3C81_2006950 [compost metagenome]